MCLFIFAKHKRSWRDVVTALKMGNGAMHLSESVVERMTSEVPMLFSKEHSGDTMKKKNYNDISSVVLQ